MRSHLHSLILVTGGEKEDEGACVGVGGSKSGWTLNKFLNTRGINLRLELLSFR